MLGKKILPLGALLCLAAAVPVDKRDVVWVTTTVVEEISTYVSTTTVMLSPGQSPPTAPAAPPQQPTGSPPHGVVSHHSPVTSHVHKTVTVHNHPTHHPVTSHVHSTVTVHNTPSPTPTPSTTPSAAPTASTPATPSSSPTSAAPTPSSTGSSPSGSKYSGDITFYTPGLGSCGKTNSASDMIVALAEDMMLPGDGDNPNDNPLCGRSITISYGGKTAVARIEDTCPGCAGASLDLTPALFKIFAPLATGRVSGVDWWYN